MLFLRKNKLCEKQQKLFNSLRKQGQQPELRSDDIHSGLAYIVANRSSKRLKINALLGGTKNFLLIFSKNDTLHHEIIALNYFADIA